MSILYFFVKQERVMKRVEQLLSLCDALEAQLTAAETHRRHILESLLSQLTTYSP